MEQMDAQKAPHILNSKYNSYLLPVMSCIAWESPSSEKFDEREKR